MSPTYLLIAILPLVAYVVVDAIWGLRAGILTAMAAILFILTYHYIEFSTIDTFILGEGLFILVFGLISLGLNNGRFFKLQPVVLGVLLVGLMLWFEVFSEPILLKMLPTMMKMAPEFSEMFADPDFVVKLRRISAMMIVLLSLHTAMVAWSAFRWSNFAWLMTRLAIYPLTFTCALIVSIF